LPILKAQRLDAVVVGLPHHVQYLSGHRPRTQHEGAVVLFSDGRCVLISANEPVKAPAADQVVAYEANWMSTARQDQPAVVADHVLGALQTRHARRVGIDASAVTSEITLEFDGGTHAIDSVMWQMRRRKDPDELESMKTAIRCCQAMYVRAREIIAPGIGELQVFNELQAAAVNDAGKPLSAILGNDFACGTSGGPARKDHAAKAGEIYILDMGPAVDGYFADNCRAFAVGGKPTDAQQQAWQAIVDALSMVEKMAKPGVRCRDLFTAVDEHFRKVRGTGLRHHLGHGVGLQPHEFPHLNPRWDDVLLEGEIFTAEPGQYGPELAGGIRLENQYLVTAGGVENLLNFPLELAGG